MSKKNEALRHANKLDAHEFDEPHGAAAELRRLSAENEAFGIHLSERMKDLALVEAQRDEARRTVRDAHEAGTRLTAQRDALLAALKLAWPIIEKEKFMQDGCYGKNFIQSKAERARKAYEAARAAIKAVEGEQK